MNKYLKIFLILLVLLLTPVVLFYGSLIFGLLYYDQAHYSSEGINLGSPEYYNDTLANARAAGYKTEIYYVNANKNEMQRFYPGPVKELDSVLGPDYIVNSLEIFYNSDSALLSVSLLTNGQSSVSFYNDYNTDYNTEYNNEHNNEYNSEANNSMKFAADREWVIELFKIMFGLNETETDAYLPKYNSNIFTFYDVKVVEPLNFTTTRGYLAEQATDYSFDTQTFGEGNCPEVFSKGNQTLGIINYIVPNTEISHREGLKTYIVKIDQLGGLTLRLNLGPGSSGNKVSEEEYRAVFKKMFEDLGLPLEKFDDIKFDYTGSIW